MNDYYTTGDTKVSKGESWRTTERASWLRKFNPGSYARSYAMFIFIFIIIIVIIFIIYWRYIRPKCYKKYMKNYYNLKGSNTLILQTKNNNCYLSQSVIRKQTVIC